MVEDLQKKLKEIKKDAIEDKVPIMQDETISFITNLIARKNIRNILEIGTAVGYSSIVMALSNPNLKITTIEKDNVRYMKALKNIKEMDLEDRITLIFNDALEVTLKEKYDLIVIDAAKSKNQEMFENFERNLEEDGCIITDNLSFHGFVDKDLKEIESRNVRGLVKKIREYRTFLEEHPKYKTVIHDIGDTISVTEKKIDEDTK